MSPHLDGNLITQLHIAPSVQTARLQGDALLTLIQNFFSHLLRRSKRLLNYVPQFC